MLIVTLAVVTVIALTVRAGSIDIPFLDANGTELEGVTASGEPLRLGLDDGKVSSVAVRLPAVCRERHPWEVHWGPSRGGNGSFEQRGRRFVVREKADQTDPGGELKRISVVMRGRLGADRKSAEGHVWLTARFYRGSTQFQACESGAVRWVVR